jgi:hypothetical protein
MAAFPSLGISEMDIVQFLLFVLIVTVWKAISAVQLIAEMLLEAVDPRKVDIEQRMAWRKRLKRF